MDPKTLHEAYVALVPKLEAAAQEFRDLGGASTPAGRELLARAWKEHDHFSRSEPPEPTYWPVWTLNSFLGEDPDTAWHLILAILSHDPPRKALYALALGVRRLLVWHGEAIMSRIEAQAAIDPAWRLLLGAIWLDGDIETLWPRISPLRGPLWELEA